MRFIAPLFLPYVAALPCAVAAPPAAGDVLVVDAAGGGDFARIAAAAAAAADGDVVLVRAGTYTNEGAIALGGRTLTITADAGASVAVEGSFHVDGLAAADRVVLRGLDVSNGVLSRCLTVSDCSGSVWVEDCSFEGFPASLFDAPDPLVVRDSDAVVLVRCTSVGGTGVGGLSGGSGLSSVRSIVVAQDCVLTGGEGAKDPSTLAGLQGGAGVLLEDGTLLAAGGRFTGGKGGDGGSFGLCADGGDGGIGIHLRGTDPGAALRAVELAGGDPGLAVGAGSCSHGLPGADWQVDAGTLSTSDWPPHAAAYASPVRADELALASFEGPPGSLVWSGASGLPGVASLPALNGVLHLSVPIHVRFEGALDGSGTLLTTRSVFLPAGMQATAFHAQALFLDPCTGAFTLGTPGAVVVLDAAL